MISLNRASTGQVHIFYSTTDWDASAGDDYEYANSDITLAPGQTQAIVTVQTHTDGDATEGTERMTLDLFHIDGADGIGNYGTGHITDN